MILIILALAFGCDDLGRLNLDDSPEDSTADTPEMTLPETSPQDTREVEGDLPEAPSPEEARADLNGVDRDGDAVRDDVQIMVRGLELNAEEEATLQLARGLGDAIQVGANPDSSPDEVTRAGERLARAADCLFFRFGARATQQVHMMNLLMADTPERALGYQSFERRTSGQSFAGASRLEEACD